MIKWVSSELHTHTINSDGSLTLEELCKKAKELEIDCIALTDHNTISGHLEICEAIGKTGIKIIPGLEWTTFYGHVVTLGLHRYVDWRNRGLEDIEKGIEDIHNAGAIAGIAHPFRAGSPMCTGCYWQFKIYDWNCIDYIEVWSGEFPPLDYTNTRAFKLWTDLLNKGYRITAVSGRDWHGGDEGYMALTYLGLEQNIDDNINTYLSDSNKNNKKDCIKDSMKDSLRDGMRNSFEMDVIKAILEGHSIITMGPLIILSVMSPYDETVYIPGSKIIINEEIANMQLEVNLDYSVRKGKWKFDNKIMTVVIDSNIGIIRKIDLPYGCEQITLPFSTDGLKWLRASLYGSIEDKNIMVAFTNPVYFERYTVKIVK